MTIRLHVIRTRYPHWGAHSGIHQYLRHLDPEHFQVELYEAADGDDDFPIRNPQVRKRLRGLVQRGMSWYKLSDLWAETRALRRCWRGRTDLVHYLDGEHSAQYLPTLPRRGVPVVASFHQPPELLGTMLSDRSVRRLDRAIAVSPTQVPWLSERLGEDRVDLILHGIDTGFFRPGAKQPGDGPFRCITVGHYLRDFAAIRETVHRLASQDVEFHVVTNRDTGLEGLTGVHRHQDVDDKRLLALYQQADALLLPVTSSTANNALLEGIACGLPVISTRMASIEAYVPGEETILVEGNDGEELAQAILRLRDDPGLARAMGRRARARAEELSWQRIAPLYAASYGALVGAPHPLAPSPIPSPQPGEGGRIPTPRSEIVSADRRGGQGVRGFSVILPAHNAAVTLAETLASLQSQTFPHWEAIVIDDASTDATLEIARQAAATDPRLRVIPGPGNGPSAARNEGIAHASADWLLFLDADDLLAPEHLERIAAALEGGDHDGALCGWVRFAPDGRRGPEQLPEEGDLFPALACYCAPAIHSCVVRRSLVEEVGRFDPSLRTCEDWDLWQRLARAGARFARVPEILALYRMVPESASHDPQRLLEDGLRVIDRGHAPDQRVPRPSSRWAAGQQATGLSGARLRFATWAAGLALGRGEDARPLLEKVARDRDPALAPADVAGTLFQAALLPGCRVPEDWIALWPELDSAITDFLAALEAASGAKHLAALTRREMERLAIKRSTAPRPFTLGSIHAVEIELTEPLQDIPVPSPAERLHVIATLEGETLGSIELPIVLETVPSMLLADALTDRFAWTILGRFLERQGRGSLSWELFLQEIWGHPGWPMSRFYDPADATDSAPRVHADGFLDVEVSGELPSVKLSGPTDVALHVGGATIGRLRLPMTEGVMEAHALRVFLTATSGFELCRAAVREALLGQPLTASGTLRDRLAAAALRSRPRDHRGVLLAHHPDAPLSSPASRLAFLPVAALPELLDLANATGQGVASMAEQPPWVLYAPDCFMEPPPRIEEAVHGRRPPQIAQRVLWNDGSPRHSDPSSDLRTWSLPILLYRRVAPDGATATARYRVTPEAFEEQLRFLRDSGYHTPHLGDWLRSMEAKEPLPGRAVLFTFHDYRDFAEHAWPLLRRYGFTALVFLVADAVGGTNHWEEIRRLHAEGVELGSHTATHRPLTALSPTDVVREVARSRAVLTRGLGGPVEAIAYPHGAVDEVVRHLTGACGYRSGLTCNPARSGFDDPPLALPRLEVRGDASFADFVALLGGG